MSWGAQPGQRRQIALSARGVCKRFGVTVALDSVDLEVAPGEIHALLGGNGSGKSTLIKILAGVVQADAGELTVAGATTSLRRHSPTAARQLGVHVVHQQPAVFPGQSVAENLAIGRGFEGGPLLLNRAGTVRHAAAVLERFEIPADPTAPLGAYSQATQTMIAIARALQDQDGERRGILTLDEPTAALPAHEVASLLAALRRYAAAGQSIVLVTHRLDEVIGIADRATILRDARRVAELVQDEIDHDALVEGIVGRRISRQAESGPAAAAGGQTIRLSGWSVGQLQRLELGLAPGEIVGVAGLLGSGRSTLLRSIFGLQLPREGQLFLDGVGRRPPRTAREAMRLGFALVPEDRQLDGVFADLSVRENLMAGGVGEFWNGALVRSARESAAAATALRRFAIKAAGDGATLSSLSGGNQQKVVLARWLRREPSLLLLDEPSQGVDIGSRVEIHALIRKAVSRGAAALVVSSDFEELASLADRVLVLADGHIADQLSRGQLSPETITDRVYKENVSIHG